MLPEHYANEYRRYQTYVRNYDESKPIKKICCGPNVDDYEWTKVVLDTAYRRTQEHQHGFMDGLSLHYYVVPSGNWDHKGSAVEFDTSEWYQTLKKACYMDELVTKHGKIMDEYDPDKKVGLIVDEWGAWYDVEPGTNPGFLYQQNTVRDALIAAITLNIFNKHSDRVKMACLAQMVNVLQAVILTEGEKMVKTPTYHVLHMYRHHQDGQLLSSSLTGMEQVGTAEYTVPKLTESVSVNDEGVITVTIGNLSDCGEEKLTVQLEESGYQVIEARIVGGPAIQSHNTFEEPEVVTEKAF